MMPILFRLYSLGAMNIYILSSQSTPPEEEEQPPPPEEEQEEQPQQVNKQKIFSVGPKTQFLL